VPQADTSERVAELPLLVEQGINNSAKVATHYRFDPRQAVTTGKRRGFSAG
jgi:hypothetical protein